ncbi:hypothetical protein [Paraburkholderia fynbosensis]|uniref:Uncharacterized protein n=1 Tax=Paraburkholderia fynbosensis TaxID=1200993 RepID=A0A6J5GWX9_9BURK|nr:hypothetical protein [Paraburkholderia fynbosensis]CAB3807318.1 hypothetical protein LMG27177_06309 [Paraburkholderia fynbosensis]
MKTTVEVLMSRLRTKQLQLLIALDDLKSLDVFRDKPNVGPDLRGLESVVLTPHMASGTAPPGRRRRT